MDAIVNGNLEIVETLLPLTILKPGIFLHLAITYGQFYIFKYLCGLFEDWKSLKDKKGRNVQQILDQKNYLFELNDMEPGEIICDPKFADKIVSCVFLQKICVFIREN